MTTTHLLSWEPLERLLILEAGCEGRAIPGAATAEWWLTDRQMGELVGVEARSIARWRNQGGLPPAAADRAAVRIGRHPAEIWGDAWWDAEPPPPCGTNLGRKQHLRNGEDPCDECRLFWSARIRKKNARYKERQQQAAQ